MEQHPVPQNVTTFQFRLIGDMTLKQFGYLIAGAILAFIAYKLPLPFIITWPLTGAFAFLGVGFAFIPVEERPMDVWVFSFFKSIYSPTQYIWSHEAPSTQNGARPPSVSPSLAPPASPPIPQAVPTTKKTVLSGLFQQSPQALPLQKTVTNKTGTPPQHQSLLDEMFSFFAPRRSTAPPKNTQAIPPISVPSVTGYRPQTPLPPQPIPTDTASEAAMHQKMTHLEETLKNLEEKLATKTVTEDRVLELQKQLTDVVSQKNLTENELVALKRQIDGAVPPTVTPNTASAVHGVVNVITTQEGAVKVGLPRLTNSPNVITGLVKDDTGNLLPGILVTVTNSEGIPVRALKTNKLGQFAASTPLSSGVYFVEIEDPRNRFTFSRVQITLNGSVVPVLEIIAKSEKALTRERLAQEIFGKPIA